MNKKEETIYKILDIVIDECEVTEDAPITRETMLGKCKRENVCMARCMFVTMLRYMGYSVSTIAAIVHRSEQAVSDILTNDHQYRIKSPAYLIAEAECVVKLKQFFVNKNPFE